MAAYLCRRCKQLLPVARSDKWLVSVRIVQCWTFYFFRSLANCRSWNPHPSLVSVHSRLLCSSTETLPVPPPDGAARIYPDKIRAIVDQITQLTLLETAQLNELLKVHMLYIHVHLPSRPRGYRFVCMFMHMEVQIKVISQSQDQWSICTCPNCKCWCRVCNYIYFSLSCLLPPFLPFCNTQSTLNIPDAPMMVQGGPPTPAAQEVSIT